MAKVTVKDNKIYIVCGGKRKKVYESDNQLDIYMQRKYFEKAVDFINKIYKGEEKSCTGNFIYGERWDKHFINIAREASTMSKDESTKVGAVIVDEYKRIVSTGFNGLPYMLKDTECFYKDRDLKYQRILHAEQNAILFARRDLVYMSLYVYPFIPCNRCALEIIQSGMKNVCIGVNDAGVDAIERWEFENILSIAMFLEANINVVFYRIDA